MDEMQAPEFKKIVDTLLGTLNEHLLPKQTPYTVDEIEMQLKFPYSALLIAAAITAQRILLKHREEELDLQALLNELETLKQSPTDTSRYDEAPPPPPEAEKEIQASHQILDAIEELEHQLMEEWHHMTDDLHDLDKLHSKLINTLQEMDQADHELKHEQKEELHDDIKKELFPNEELSPDASKILKQHVDELHNTLWELGAKKAEKEEESTRANKKPKEESAKSLEAENTKIEQSIATMKQQKQTLVEQSAVLSSHLKALQSPLSPEQSSPKAST